MSSTHQPFQPQPFGHRQSFDPAARWRRNLAGKLRWSVAWAALLALAIIAFQDANNSPPIGITPAAEAEGAAAAVPFDGRGKWSGYAR